VNTMNQKLPANDEDLGIWLKTRLGYGSPEARVIFLGQDESMVNRNNVPNEFLVRMYRQPAAPGQFGAVAAPWDDIFDAHAIRLAGLFHGAEEQSIALKMGNLVSLETPTYQATWARLGAFLHGYRGIRKDRGSTMINSLLGEVKRGNIALAEWWPMPAPSGIWPYHRAAQEAAKNHPHAAALLCRKTYEEKYQRDRINAIDGLVNSYHPRGRVIIGYTDHFGRQKLLIAPTAQPVQAPWPSLVRGAWTLQNTLLLWVYHPNAREGMNAFQRWVDLGTWVRHLQPSSVSATTSGMPLGINHETSSENQRSFSLGT